MRKSFVSLVLFIFVALFSAQTQAATATSMPIAIDLPPANQTTDIFGQDHYYSVTLRGNGELVVSGRMLFSNTDSVPMSALTLHVPSGTLKDVTIYQVSRSRICEQYDYRDYTNTKQDMSDNLRLKQPIQPPCIKYREPAYYDYLYGQNTYTKATHTYKDDVIDVSLPKSVAPGSTAGILLFYRSDSLAKKTLFGAYDYEFKTLKVPGVIHTLQVGIASDADLYIKGSKGSVQYNSSPYMTSSIMKNDAGGVASSQLDSYYQQIGQGSEVKSASNLQPLESYTVKGSYADAQWKLYGTEALIGLVAISVILGICILLVKKFTHIEQVQSNKKAQSIMLVSVLSILSTLCITGYTIAIYFMMNLLQSSYYSQFNIVITLLLLVISCGIYLILLVGPAVWIGVTRGVSYGISTGILTVFLLCIALVIMIAGLFITRNPYPAPYPMPMGISGSTGAAISDTK